MSQQYEKYYVPEQSPWPFIGAVALFLIAVGAGNLVIEVTRDKEGYGGLTLVAGFTVLVYMLFGWFRNQIHESMSGLYSAQLSESYRQGMAWFIFSEVMFFCAFFGALAYARIFSGPWLDGASNNAMTHEVLWPMFEYNWPLLKTPDGTETTSIAWNGLPLINTIILLTSSVTCHMAHKALEKNNRGTLTMMLAITVLFGVVFLILQGIEYQHAFEIGLKLDSGIYGNTFFLLTGFHGLHVTLGTILLIIMLLRIMKGHFTPDNHFAFQAASWYWHFVDVVWVALFFIVYIL